MQKITSQTHVLGVIGDPIAHSLSPHIHNYLYREQGIDAVYLAAHVSCSMLDYFVKTLPILNWKGFNVTMPHKLAIQRYLSNSVSDSIGCNTVKINASNELVGTSTDAEGFLQSLDFENIDISGKNVLILGAGAVVRSLCQEVSKKNPSHLLILNRDREKAQAILSQVSNSGISSEAKTLNEHNLAEEIHNVDVLINATPMGMRGYPGKFPSFSFLHGMKKEGAVIDLIYMPQQTELLANANALGLRTLNGLGMLVGQALKAHEYWFNEPTGADLFYKVMEELGNQLVPHKV